MQKLEEIDKWYESPDPWGYTRTPDDALRKEIILVVLGAFPTFKRALDIGCGEGFITTDLPADKIEGIEISDKAAARLPANVKRVSEPKGKYDLIVCTGMLYEHYDYPKFTDWIINHAGDIVLTCNIKEWEHNDLPEDKQMHYQEFDYREYIQVLRLYKW